jgi:hypothetical protein
MKELIKISPITVIHRLDGWAEGVLPNHLIIEVILLLNVA